MIGRNTVPLLLGVGSSSCLSSRDLRGKRESVGEEKLGKTRELGNLFLAQLIVIMGSLISVKPDQMGPVLEIIGQPSSLMKCINPRREILFREARVQLSCSNVESLPVHGRCSVRMTAGSIVRALNVSPANRRRDVLRNFHSLWARIDVSYHRVLRPALNAKLPVALSDPAMITRRVVGCYADQVIAGVAAKYDGWISPSRCGSCHVTHRDRLSEAMGAGINEGGRHE